MRAILGFAADVGFSDLYGLVSAAEAAFVAVRGIAHCFTNAMREKPRGAIRAESEIAHEPMRADALLAGRHEMDRQQPLVERNVRTLHHSASAASELVPAVVAQKHSGLRFTGHAMNIERTAQRAVHFVRPAGRFDVGASGILIREAREVRSVFMGKYLQCGNTT